MSRPLKPLSKHGGENIQRLKLKTSILLILLTLYIKKYLLTAIIIFRRKNQKSGGFCIASLIIKKIRSCQAICHVWPFRAGLFLSSENFSRILLLPPIPCP